MFITLTKDVSRPVIALMVCMACRPDMADFPPAMAASRPAIAKMVTTMSMLGANLNMNVKKMSANAKKRSAKRINITGKNEKKKRNTATVVGAKMIRARTMEMDMVTVMVTATMMIKIHPGF